jgi:hypothetical protein
MAQKGIDLPVVDKEEKETSGVSDLDTLRQQLLYSRDVNILKDLAANLLEELARLRGAMEVTEWYYYVGKNWSTPTTMPWAVCYNFMGKKALFASTPNQDNAKKLAMLLNLEASGKIGSNQKTRGRRADWLAKGSPELTTGNATAARFTLEYGNISLDLRTILENLLDALTKMPPAEAKTP